MSCATEIDMKKEHSDRYETAPHVVQNEELSFFQLPQISWKFFLLNTPNYILRGTKSIIFVDFAGDRSGFLKWNNYRGPYYSVDVISI